mgnify:CR=1 FL=1
MREETLFGASLLLIATRTTEGCVKLILLKGVKQRNFPLRVDVEKGSVDEVKKKSHTFTLENIKEDKGEVEINGQKMWCFVGDIGNTFFIANSTAEPGRVVILRAATYAYEQSEEIKKSFDTFKIK